MTLSEYLASTNQTETDFAVAVGCSQGTVNKLKRGTIRPSLELAGRIARATEGRVTPNDFLNISAPSVSEVTP